ncbi:MAG: DNA glycosylase [Methanobacteriaceae archaeon]
MAINSKIDLKLTQESGQTSQSPWNFLANQYCEVVKVANTYVLLKVSTNSDNNEIIVNYETEINSTNNINELDIINSVNNIFDLNFDLDKFYNYLSECDELAPAIEFCQDLRLFKARDPFECIVSSISSANNSISRWTKSIATINHKWGNNHKFTTGDFFTFPSPETIITIPEDDLAESLYSGIDSKACFNNLKACGVGYRGPYIKKTAELVLNEISINDISNMSYNEAFEAVLALPGVGPKVADCILLYGFGMNEAFPSDVWIKRIISHLYFNDKDITAKKARDFGMSEFGEYAGYVQLYLFHYARKSGLLAKLKKK